MNNAINNFKANFYNNIELSMETQADYLIELSKIKDVEKAEEEEIAQVQALSRALKIYFTRIHLQINTLDKKKTIIEKENNTYKEIMKTPLVNEEQSEKYILLANNFLIDTLGDISFNDVAEQF